MKLGSLLILLTPLLVGTCVSDRNYQDDRDYKVIQTLKDSGSDVSRPHDIDFFLYFETLAQAGPVAQAMEADGFAVRVFENEDGSVSIEARKTLVPKLETMQKITRRLNALSGEHGGNYDGWGTEVVD